MLLDGGLSEHWPDALLAAFLAAMGCLFDHALSRMEKRHERAENKFEEQGKTLGNHETRITVIEKTRGS